MAILGDPRPKIRIANFKNDFVTLKKEQQFILDTALGADEGDENQVKVDHKDLPQDLKPDDVLWLDDGKVQPLVTAIKTLIFILKSS